MVIKCTVSVRAYVGLHVCLLLSRYWNQFSFRKLHTIDAKI